MNRRHYLKIIATLLTAVMTIGLCIPQFRKFRLELINTLRPASFDGLIEFDGRLSDPRVLRPYGRYFSSARQLIGARYDVRFMEAYCQFYVGNPEGARHSLDESLRVNPQFFWARYNRAVINLKAGRYDEAEADLEEAVKIPPELTIKLVVSSPVYRQILASKSVEVSVQKGLAQAYRRALAVLTMIKKSNPPQSTFDNLHLEIF